MINPTTQPAAIMDGALKTVAGQKGSGLALLGQILACALVGADSFNNDSDNAGNIILAINLELFKPSELFEQEVSGIVKSIKKARRLPGVDEIFVPGERGNRQTKHVLETGEVEVEDNLLQALKVAANSK